MKRLKTDMTMQPTAFLPERGKSREEYYSPSSKEPFGLNKRARRLARGRPVTLPDGTYPKEVGQ